MRQLLLIALAFLFTLPIPAQAAKKGKTETAKTETAKTEAAKDELLAAETFAGLTLRGIGPAINSGRIGDFAVNPKQRKQFYVAVSSGGVWRTDNAGTTWTPVFDKEGSYSIGCVTLDPNNPHVVWVGTGENNSQRSVSWGNGVYRSLDGGHSWTNMGLEHSEHIGMITIDPRDSRRIFVAAQGPLWRPGDDRGLYRSTDGGENWEKVRGISDVTGVSEVVMDPRDPDLLYAVAYQRGRHVWSLINGGPESAIYKSTDGGDTWRKLEQGLPKVELGRIGITVSPANPDVLYAIIEAARDEGGVFRSLNRGETWEKRCDYMTSSPQYYNELVADPVDVLRVYALDTFLHVSVDGGATFKKVGEEHKHVDNHALWIDPDDPEYLLAGCDGGVYESFDRGATWLFKENLPVTQLYRVSVDSSKPFYYVYGGTQDNNTLGGPSRTLARSGISNEDWFITVGGDGFKTQVAPENPDIVYSQWQHGGLVRYDRRSGEAIDIQPQEQPGEAAHRWNWDSPLLISPHRHPERPSSLYFACQRVYRSDDRGDSWTPISEDLTRQLDRDTLPVLGKIWGVDAVSKNRSTSAYGNIVSLSESPLVEGLLYAGTDDGLIQVTEDGGASWRPIDSFPGIPERSYVSRIEASLHDKDTVYAAFDNHKQGDFKPYLLKSSDRGRSWVSIVGDLPENEVVWALVQDHEDPDLLFAGTELGLSFTFDEGAHWVRLNGGLPTIAVRDLAIQQRENDLALATFGRGFYLLDDFTPLRNLSRELLEQEVVLFPIKNALRYVEQRSRQGSRGHSFFTAPNPPFGAVITYYLKDGLKTRRELRIEAEKKAAEQHQQAPYPSYEELRTEDEEHEPVIVLTVRDSNGDVVRRLTGPRDKGFHRVAWDLRFPATTPVDLQPATNLAPWESPDKGPLALPGDYTVTLSKEVDGVVTQLAGPQPLLVKALGLATLAAEDREALQQFQQQVASLQRAVSAAGKVVEELESRIAHVKRAVLDTPDADLQLLAEVQRLETALNEIKIKLEGDKTREKRAIPTPPSIADRINDISDALWDTTNPPTETFRQSYRHAGESFTEQLQRLHAVVAELGQLEQQLEQAGAPWTPGRLPTWTMEQVE